MLSRATMENQPQAFQKAIDQYIKSCEKGKIPNFVNQFQSGQITTAEDVNASIIILENHDSQRGARKILQPVVDCLSDFGVLIESMCFQEPNAPSILWGGFKTVIECAQRYCTNIEKIANQLKGLTIELRRLERYEALFSESEDLLIHLVASYISVIKFWARAERQFSMPRLIYAIKGSTSVSNRNLDEILIEIRQNAACITAVVPIVQESLRRGENRDIVEMQRKVNETLSQLNQSLNKNYAQENEARQRSEILKWIYDGVPQLNERNIRLQDQRMSKIIKGSGNWLFETSAFQKWLCINSDSKLFWLYGDPGVGKSMLCSKMVDAVKSADSRAAVIINYFIFDEQDTLLTIYRNIALQLFQNVYGPSRGTTISDEVYQLTKGPVSRDAMQAFIELLVSELRATYIFLDGLDEELQEDERAENTKTIIKFLRELTDKNHLSLKLFCSSQRRNAALGPLMDGAEEMELDAVANSGDIDQLFADAADVMKNGIFSSLEGFLVFNTLKKVVNGNFLWASYMLQELNDALSTKQMMEVFLKGLPTNFENYLQERMRKVNSRHHEYLSKVLSCLAFSKRPLSLSELCEAIATSDLETGDDLDESHEIFPDKLLQKCEPFVCIEDIETNGHRRRFARLGHHSLKTFLLQKPYLFSLEEKLKIKPEVLAIGCLKYLQQAKYRELLIRLAKTFITGPTGEDISGHALLNYAAKYWYRQMDKVSYSEALCQEVEDFVRSPSFFTLLQLQSLFVDGQFRFWLSSGKEEIGKQLVRAFPRWFTEHHHCGNSLHQQYQRAIGDWGHFLADSAEPKFGKYPGEINRCSWSMLGKSNFLSKLPSIHKKAFVLDKDKDKQNPRSEPRSMILLEKYNQGGTEITLVRLGKQTEKESYYSLIVQSWALSRGHGPKMQETPQEIRISPEALKPHGPTQQKSEDSNLPEFNTSTPVQLSDDASLLQIGALIYYLRNDVHGSFEELELPSPLMKNTEGLSSCGEFIALVFRCRLSEPKVPHEENKVSEPSIVGRNGDVGGKPMSFTEAKSSNPSSESTTSSSSSDSESSISAQDDQRLANSLSSRSDDFMSIKSYLSEMEDEFDLRDFDATDTSSTSANSARDSWSEASTAAFSDEVNNDEIWNDFASDNDFMIEDDRGSLLSDDAGDYDGDLEDALDTSSRQNGSYLESLELLSRDFPDSYTGSEVSRSSLATTSSDLSDIDDSDSSVRNAGQILNELLAPKSFRNPSRGLKSELRVFRVSKESNRPMNQVFYYRHQSQRHLYASSAVFHPTKELLVWPVAPGELLFANFTQNTFFTRTIFTAVRSSQISVECRFSSDGLYLSMASLDAYPLETLSAKELALKLHIATYRLSVRKTTRAPPRLIFQTAINLSPDLDFRSFSAGALPYTLTWTNSHLYMTESQPYLRVYRIPLFQAVQKAEQTQEAPKAVFTNSGDVFFPRSAARRKVYFFPETEQEEERRLKSKSRREKYMATVLIAAEKSSKGLSSTTDSLLDSSVEATPSQGIHLTPSDFGHWKSAEGDQDDTKGLRRAETWKGGQLIAKFEDFDTSEESDVVPYHWR